MLIFKEFITIEKSFKKLPPSYYLLRNPDEPELKKKICHQDTKAPRYTKGFYYNFFFLCFSWCLGALVAMFCQNMAEFCRVVTTTYYLLPTTY